MKQLWNRNEWQGRSRRQVEGNYKAMGLMFKLIAIGFAIGVASLVILNIT